MGGVTSSTRHCELGPVLRSRPGLDETVRSQAGAVFWKAVGKEVGFSLVRESPVASWTRVAWMTLTGADGQHRPGARFLGFSSNRRLCRRRSVKEKNMDILYERVAGLDVHKDTVVACVRIVADGKTKRECRTFTTTTEQLAELRAWLEECRCTHVAMEATGVYWMPVFRILGEGQFELTVANAAHIKNVPGRKTDMNDAMWIADLLACGLIKASFVPPGRDAGAACLDAHPQAAGTRADAACAADREDAGGSQYQARLGDLRHHGRERAADHRGDDRRRAPAA